MGLVGSFRSGRRRTVGGRGRAEAAKTQFERRLSFQAVSWCGRRTWREAPGGVNPQGRGAGRHVGGRFWKRVIDVGTCLLGLLPAAVVGAIVGLAVWLSMGRPVLFRQVRPGRYGRLFEVLKFRTMTDARAADGTLLPDSQRLTRLGRFLRKTSLDELPQLWNVLRGEMSLVGPRPLLPEYLDRYTPEQARRHEVRPGITGWAQVNGRNATTWEERLRQDVWYVDNWSLWLDFKILWMTVVKVLRREGVSKEGHATMPEFMGTQSEAAMGDSKGTP